MLKFYSELEVTMKKSPFVIYAIIVIYCIHLTVTGQTCESEVTDCHATPKEWAQKHKSGGGKQWFNPTSQQDWIALL